MPRLKDGVFERSLRFARESGYLKGRRMKVAMDTTHHPWGADRGKGHLQPLGGRDSAVGEGSGGPWRGPG